MSCSCVQSKLALYHEYWDRKPQERPLVTFRIGDFFFSRHFEAAQPLLDPGRRITPDMLDVDAFLRDYERMYAEVSTIGQDGFWVAEPIVGIPWFEAMLGCEVFATDHSFITAPWTKNVHEIKNLTFDPQNPWFKKYVEFIAKMQESAKGRYPVAYPIMRGTTDTAGAILGQTELIYALMDQPEDMKVVLIRIAEAYRCLLTCHYQLVKEFHGGYAMGFYHLWSPGRSILMQEDLTSILSPGLYREFVKRPDEIICQGYDYTAIHLHPASFFILDDLLAIRELRVIEVNKDVGGPSIGDMIPLFRKILANKNLIIWGDLVEDDLDHILNELPQRGIFLNIVAPTVERAQELMDYIRRKGG